MVGVDDDVLAAERSHVELLGANAGEADGLPDAGHVRLPSSLERQLVLLQLHVALSELLVVGNSLVEDLGGKVELVVEAAVTAVLHVGLVRVAHEALEVAEPALATLRVSKDELVVHTRVLQLRAGHKQVLDESLRVVLLKRKLDDGLKLSRIIGLDESLNGRGERSLLLELGLAELGPGLGLVGLLGELGGLLNIVELVDDDLDGVDGLVDLLVDGEGFLVELVLVLEGHLRQLVAIVVVQTHDVVHHAGRVRTDRSQDQQVLETLILSEV
mmetsp:Transcript_9248/g.11256  ORF Transcript_9248/g.11256 Transcript_9248/m.11256 type:complete len:272 (+) Transcript_9248:1351-2166(+)